MVLRSNRCAHQLSSLQANQTRDDEDDEEDDEEEDDDDDDDDAGGDDDDDDDEEEEEEVIVHFVVRSCSKLRVVQLFPKFFQPRE